MTTNIVDKLNAKVARDQASDDEVARIAGMTQDEYAADVTRLDHADAQPEDQCYNCGAYGRELGNGEYCCPICGDTWNIYEPPPDIP